MPHVVAAPEYERVRAGAGLLERSDRAMLRLTGEGAAAFLQGQVTNDVEGLAPGTGCYAALLTHKGKMRADMRVLRGPDWIWLDLERGGLDAMAGTIATFSIGHDLRHEDVSSDYAILSLLGPESAASLDTAPPDAEHAFVEGAHGLHVRTDLGVDVICPASESAAVREAIGVEPVSAETAECLRIESGRPRFGCELTGDTIPQEGGINERAVDFEKGCYVGQETVARLHYKGKPNRMLRGLRLSEPARGGDRLRLGERDVGTIGSACESPALGPIALAVVRKEAEPGSEIAVGQSEAPAIVVELPFDRG